MTPKVEIDKGRVPTHIAIIMDGNGRWAKEQGKSRSYGHQIGVDSVREIIGSSSKLGIRFLTLYTFSNENWNRPQEEVDALMTLLVSAIEHETPMMMEKNFRLTAIGDLTRLPKSAAEKLTDCMNRTAANSGLTIVLALSYSSRWEIRHAVQQIVRSGIDPEEVTDELIGGYLTTARIPDPDLLIRTGGEQRISNFLLWQLSYAELYFTPIYWPEFREPQLLDAIADFQQRERRFGKTTEQLS